MAKLQRLVKHPINNWRGTLKSRLKKLFMSLLRPRPGRAGLAFLAAAASFAFAAQPAYADEAPKKPAAAEPKAPVLLDVDAQLGLFTRLNNHAYLDTARRTGLNAGAGFFLAPLSSFALGLHYEHSFTGRDRFVTDSVNSLETQRSMHTLFLDLRVHPLRRPAFSITADFGIGLGWQMAETTFISDPSRLGRDVHISACSAKDTASIGFRAGLGAELPLSKHLFLNGQASIATMRFTDALIGQCAPGAGTTNALTLRAGFLYRFDLSGVFVNR